MDQLANRKYISAVFLVLFLALLAGNMMSYVLCPIAITMETSVKDCGCDDIFKTINSNPGENGDLKTSILKTVSTESMPPETFAAIGLLQQPATGYHAAYQMNLPYQIGNAVFRPPVA
ncbi:MAG: hypothetical protein WBP58_02850 [Chitinophagaceae bacterium]